MTAKFSFWWEQDPDWSTSLHDTPFYQLDTGTTVSDVTLNKLGIAIPLTPDFFTWQALVESGKRCRNCWADKDCTHGQRRQHETTID